jgi:hypothetical protein
MAIHNQDSKDRTGRAGFWFLASIAFIFSALALGGTGLTLFQVTQLRQEISGLKQLASRASTAPEQTAQNSAASPDPTATTAPSPTTPAAGGAFDKVYEAKGTADGRQFTVRLTELKRTGNAVVARFSFTTEEGHIGGKRTLSSGDYTLSKYDMDIGAELAKDSSSTENKTISATYLIDTTNQKKHEVMRDANNNPLCSRIPSNIGGGDTVDMYAQFTAPPPSTQTVNIFFAQASPFIGVPLQ